MKRRISQRISMTPFRLAAAVLLFLFLAAPSFANQITDVGPSARSIGMGKAYSGFFGDSDSMHFNPAGIAKIPTFEFTTMYASLIGEFGYSCNTVIVPSRFGNLGFAYVWEDPGAFYTTTRESGGRITQNGSFGFNSSAIVIDYANQMFLNDLYVGARMKYYNKGSSYINGATGSGFGADFGAIYDMGALTVGFSLNNFFSSGIIWSNRSTEEIGSEMRFGAGYKLMKGMQLAVDGSMKKKGGFGLSAGLEWDVMDNLTVRAGMEQKSAGETASGMNMAFGGGTRLSNLSIDYTMLMDGMVTKNTTHFISLSLVFDPNAGETPGRIRKLSKEELQELVSLIQDKLTADINTFTNMSPGGGGIRGPQAGTPQDKGGDVSSKGGEKSGAAIASGTKDGTSGGRDTKGQDAKGDKGTGSGAQGGGGMDKNQLPGGAGELAKGDQGKGTEGDKGSGSEGSKGGGAGTGNAKGTGDKDAASSVKGRSGSEALGGEADTIRMKVKELMLSSLNNFYLGAYEPAIDQCEQILKYEPDNVTALKRLGSIYFLLNKKDKALTVWEKAYKISPDNKELKQFIDAIRK